MLLRCFLIHITIIILRHILYLIYLFPCLGQSLFISYLCDLILIYIFIFSHIFIIIKLIISLKQTLLSHASFLQHLLFLDDSMDDECKSCSNSKSSASRFCLHFAYFLANFILVLIIKQVFSSSLHINNTC